MVCKSISKLQILISFEFKVSIQWEATILPFLSTHNRQNAKFNRRAHSY